MKNITLLICAILIVMNAQAQMIELAGKAKVMEMENNDNSNKIVVRDDDGTLSYRWASTLINDADASTTNEIQSLSLSGNTLGLSLGGGSVNLASFTSPWNNSGSNLYFNTGKVGIGDNSPVATLTVGNGDKFQVHGSDGDVVFSPVYWQ